MKKILLKLAATALTDKEKRGKLLTAILCLILADVLMFFLPIIFIIAFSNIDTPTVEFEFSESDFLSGLSPESQEQIAEMESSGTAIAAAMSALGLQEQTIKAQPIYMSYFAEQPLDDFTGYANVFTLPDEQLISNINGYFGLNIDYGEFMRTYTMVMNATLNEYMFTNPSEKNSADLAAWARNAYVSGWGYLENCYGEMDSERRYRCADNVGLIMGYLRYDAENKVFNTDIDTLYFTPIGGIETMPDVQGIGVYNGSDFGIYVGNGDVILSSAIGGCVVREPLADGDWTEWCVFDDVIYPQEVTDRINEIQNPTEENTDENGE